MRSRERTLTARNADKHALYERTVQCPEYEVAFASRVFRRHAGREARRLCEDFCGTARVCREWVESRPGRVATGVDRDPSVLAWGRARNVTPLGAAARRVTLLEQDVRSARRGAPFDVVLALNYSLCVFKTRDDLRAYFRRVRRSLRRDGVFILDGYIGDDAQETGEETRAYRGFTYVWDRAEFDPVSHHARFYIHFRFPDGTALRRAFRYDWRLWTAPELRELLMEAGFERTEVHLELFTTRGTGSGRFARRERAECADGRNMYLVAFPRARARRR